MTKASRTESTVGTNMSASAPVVAPEPAPRAMRPLQGCTSPLPTSTK